jgi:predicted transcriptional regulator
LASAGRGGAFGKNPYGWQGKPRRHLNFIPSELELDVLSALWDEPLQTDLELYRSLSARWPITAEQLQKILAGMADEGLLARKQISPQNLFSIFLPFGVIYVEESSLNRKNRVFVYRPTVRQKQVISVLMQKLETSTLSESEKKAYREKLKRLLKTEK